MMMMTWMQLHRVYVYDWRFHHVRPSVLLWSSASMARRDIFRGINKCAIWRICFFCTRRGPSTIRRLFCHTLSEFSEARGGIRIRFRDSRASYEWYKLMHCNISFATLHSEAKNAHEWLLNYTYPIPGISASSSAPAPCALDLMRPIQRMRLGVQLDYLRFMRRCCWLLWSWECWPTT